ncbi:MAG: enoyl-CoA hydratase/isomerase family protein [bacterium]|nr:enoyl-CoA hydratase/isomerase family protein [bacterium]
MISVDRHDQVAIVRLDRSVINALNLELVHELAETMQRLQDDPGVRSVVLTSANEKFFSIGFDIPQLIELDREGFTLYYRAFNRACMVLFTLPKPTMAAIAGHAIAGGCILTLCCDYRFIADGRKLMGVNEIKLGLPVPYPADCVLRSLVGWRNAREIMDGGELYPPETSLRMGLVDQVLPLDQVLPAAIRKAEQLGAMPQPAFATIKRNRVEMIEAQILARPEEKEQHLIEQWFSEETRELLRQAMEKF